MRRKTVPVDQLSSIYDSLLRIGSQLKEKQGCLRLSRALDSCVHQLGLLVDPALSSRRAGRPVKDDVGCLCESFDDDGGVSDLGVVSSDYPHYVDGGYYKVGAVVEWASGKNLEVVSRGREQGVGCEDCYMYTLRSRCLRCRCSESQRPDGLNVCFRLVR